MKANVQRCRGCNAEYIADADVISTPPRRCFECGATDFECVSTPAHPPINYVAQPNAYGCAIACVAMIVGKTYAEMEAWYTTAGLEQARCERGLHDAINFEALTRHGFVYAQLYLCDPLTNAPRAPWPPAPFAPVHIGCAAVDAGNHAFVMLADGTVLDPFDRGRTTIQHPDYRQVHHVTGVWRRP